MSYRSLKRVLGETSLERKCRLLFGFFLVVLVGGSFWLYGYFTDKQLVAHNRKTGRVLVNPLLVEVHWKWDHKLDSYWLPVVETLLKDVKPEELRQYRLSFIRPGSEPAEYRDAVARLRAGAEEVVRTIPGRRAYQYLGAVRAKASCLLCHQNPREANVPAAAQEGDLLAIADVQFPAGQSDLNRAIFISLGLVVFSLALVAANYFVRYIIVKPVKHLKQVSDAISRGNLSLRSEIRTGDEFEELSHAFNRMLRSLVDMQQELRRVNSDLDGKVDQLAQANMALFEMNRLKGDFLATVSHELRTPLNSILGFSDLLCTSEQLTDKQRRWIQNIQTSGKMLLDMINDILDLAKIESGKMELHLDVFSLADLVEGPVSMMRPLAERKNIDLETQIDPAIPLLRQDARKVEQILDNLLSNAIKFTPEGGRVTVAAAVAGADFVLTVADTGVGISEEDQAHIFEKFRQGGASRPGEDSFAREHQGTGLGLSIVKELCKLLDGEISLQSELGKGSTFTMRLPLHLEHKPSLEIPLAAPGVDLSKARRVDARLGVVAVREAG
ncbi:MAG: HAMP domain-containing protein [Planctomycetes bacterium]|nr:HAMP domain-containing protein [Planctomycetota bacterium]